MAYTDDLLNAAQRRRTRTGNSYFPAANTYRGININAGPSANAINSTPQGQILIRSGFSGGGGYDPGQDARAASTASRPRPNMNDYSWITTPSGGQMRVPTASLGNLLAKGTSLTGSQVTQIGNQAPIDYAAQKARGFGVPNPTVVGGSLVQGGVAAPVEGLTPQQRTQYGVTGTPVQQVTDIFRGGNPALNAYWNFGMNNLQSAGNALGGLGRNIASWFGGGNSPSIPPSANAGVPSPSPTPYQTPVPSPTPTATPFKTASDQSDLLRETEGTFYGGGQAPIPTPTPTPGPNRYVLGQPRRYSDNFGYA